MWSGAVINASVRTLQGCGKSAIITGIISDGNKCVLPVWHVFTLKMQCANKS